MNREKHQKPKIGLEDLSEDLDNFEVKSKEVEEIYNFILNNLTEINFNEILQLNEDSTVKRKDKIVVVIQKLLEKIETLRLGIGVYSSKIYVFNKSYWETVEPIEFKTFLSDVSIKFGLTRQEASYFKFKNDLLEQFKSTAHLKFKTNKQSSTLINFLNGTLEVSSKGVELREFSKEDYLSYQLKFKYDPDSEMPLFNRFINDVLPDRNLQDILAEYLGSIFIKKNVLQIEKVLLLYGTGSNGKSVLFDIIENLLGKHNMTNYGLKKLTTCPNTRAKIEHKLLNYSSEIDEIGDFNTFKQLVSREPVDAKILYKDVYTIDDYSRLMFNCNDLPSKNEITKGYFRRFLIIPFEAYIPEHKQDKNLAQKIILKELSAIFNWVLVGMDRLLKHKNFTKSSKVEEVIKEFKKQADSVKMFIEENNYQKSDTFKYLSNIYPEYREFCLRDGNKPCSKATFSKRLEHNDFIKKRKSKGIAFNLKKQEV